MQISLNQAKLVQKNPLTKSILELTFETQSPITISAGQFVTFKITEDGYRAYSICSDPQLGKERKFSIVAAVAHDGLASNHFKSMHIFDHIEFVGPSGRFVLNTPLPNDVIFVATGTGIAPFISMLYYISSNDLKNNSIKLYWGLKKSSDIFYRQILEEFKHHIDSFDYKIFLSEEENSKYEIGRVTNNFMPQDLSSHVYLCGNPNMVVENAQILIGKGFPQKNIFIERFTNAVPR